MKIAHVTRSLIVNSGVSVFTAEAANAQVVAGHEVKVWCWWYPDYPTRAASCEIRKVFTDGIEADVVHVEALWDFYCIKAMRQCLQQGIPYVVSPHGGLMPRVFTKGWLKKCVFWHLLLKPLVRCASAIHCTSEAEKRACQELGLKGPFYIIPLGVQVPEISQPRPHQPVPKTLLFLGRLGEEKGLLNLLDAWKMLAGIFPAWRLVIAGPDWRGYRVCLAAKIAEERIANVSFTGNADAKMKDALYRAADVFVLPSPMENFSMAVLDAIAYGVPAIATKGTPWGELESAHCGWWIDQGVEPLRNALHNAMALSDDERTLLGMNGRRLAARKYRWTVVAERLVACYEDVAYGRHEEGLCATEENRGGSCDVK